MGKQVKMLEVAEAQEIVLRVAQPLPPETVPLTPAALGLMLAEDVVSDLDMPPYNKALMDGYAVRAADLASGGGELAVIEEVTAGRVPTREVGRGQATRIMTGAPMPPGADAVIPRERTHLVADDRVRIEDRPPSPGLNVLARGREMRVGEVVVRAGTVLRPQEFGTLATVGRTSAQLHVPPRVAVLSTGDEVVEAGEPPGPGQIRNGNAPMLLAQVARAGGVPVYLGIARDTEASLRMLIDQGLKSPLMVLTGGVSAGKLDLVPGVLGELGVTAHFHQVKMKPGKPVFFGSREGCLVFGLPGNPVSALVCFELFVRPALRRLRGHDSALPPTLLAELAEDYAYRTDRPTYHPARLERGKRGWRVRAVSWFGSPDLRGLGASNAFVLLPPGDHQHRAGKELTVLLIEDRE
jgi:molybdopterin molybdotransferase